MNPHPRHDQDIVSKKLRGGDLPCITSITPSEEAVSDLCRINLFLALQTPGPDSYETKGVVLQGFIVESLIHMHRFHGYTKPCASSDMSAIR